MNDMRTYQTRVKPDEKSAALLTDYAALFTHAEHKFFARVQSSSDEISVIKREFLPQFGLTSRQFNAVRVTVEGKIKAIRELQKGRLRMLERQIKRAEAVIAKLASPRKIHHKRRRLFNLQKRLEALQEDMKRGRIRMCFGSRDLFRAQFALQENGFANHAAWREAWHSVRHNQFMVLGSKDENGGCQGCVAQLAEDGSITLRLRLPNALCSQNVSGSGGDKYVTLTGLRFKYGHDVMVHALGRNLSPDKRDWVALSYRFVRDERGWRVFVSTKPAPVVYRSVGGHGVLGIDINVDHLAVVRVDCKGNPVASWRIACDTRGKTAHQRRAVVGDAIRVLMAIAAVANVPIVVEKLDFSKKKAESEAAGVRRNRMLSGFAYAQIQAVLRARAYDAGIEVREVNPAWTSVIGEHKFAARYGLSRHGAAALVIGRRSMGLSERVPSQLQGTSCGSARNRREHVWSTWARFSREFRAAHAAPERPRWQSMSRRSPPLPRGPPVDDVPF